MQSGALLFFLLKHLLNVQGTPQTTLHETGYVCQMTLNVRDGVVIGDTFLPGEIKDAGISLDEVLELEEAQKPPKIILWPLPRIPIKVDL